MSITTTSALEVITDLFKREALYPQGRGSVGNPRETWDDLKAALALSFLMDTNAVFTSVFWACGRLSVYCNQLDDLCDDVVDAISWLNESTTPIDDVSELTNATRQLNRATKDLAVLGGPTAAADGSQKARSQIAEFIENKLVPSMASVDAMAPSEARAVIRNSEEDILDLVEKIDDLISYISTAVSAVTSLIPKSMSRNAIFRCYREVLKIRDRMLDQTASRRADNARSDLLSLSSCLTVLETLEVDPTPILTRGTYTVNAAGSGPGAKYTSTMSAPYQLLDAVFDQLVVSVDGAPAVTCALPSSANGLVFLTPTSHIPAGVYNIPPGVHYLWIGSNGVWGTGINIPAAPITAAALAALLNPVMPLDPFAVPYVVAGSAIDPAGNLHLSLAYNMGVATPANLDLGQHVEIIGTPTIMNFLGYTQTDEVPQMPPAGLPAAPTPVVYHTEFWKHASQMRVNDVFRRYLGNIVDVHRDNSLPFSGYGRVNNANPDQVEIWNYNGNGYWWSADQRVTLSGSALEYVSVGDEIVINGVVAGVVGRKEKDGVVLDYAFGVLVDGPYTVVITPPLHHIGVGMTLCVKDYGRDSYHHITNAVKLGNGEIQLTLSTGVWLAARGTRANVRCEVTDDKTVIGSADTGPTGSFSIQAGATSADAQLGLPAPVATITSTVYSISDVAATFISDGVEKLDVVELEAPIAATTIVDGLIDETEIRLVDAIDGTAVGVTATIYNYRYDAYNDLIGNLAGGWISTGWADLITAYTKESLRVAGASVASGSYDTLLATIKGSITNVEVALGLYRDAIVSLSPQLVMVRDAFEQAGADRAVDLLQECRLEELFAAGPDEANKAAYLRKRIRAFSRGLLGSSVYNRRAMEKEAELLAIEQKISIDTRPLPHDPARPPRRTRR